MSRHLDNCHKFHHGIVDSASPLLTLAPLGSFGDLAHEEPHRDFSALWIVVVSLWLSWIVILSFWLSWIVVLSFWLSCNVVSHLWMVSWIVSTGLLIVLSVLNFGNDFCCSQDSQFWNEMSRWDPDFPYVESSRFWQEMQCCWSCSVETNFWMQCKFISMDANSFDCRLKLLDAHECPIPWIFWQANLKSPDFNSTPLPEIPRNFFALTSVARFSSTLSSGLLAALDTYWLLEDISNFRNTKPELWNYSLLHAWLDLLFLGNSASTSVIIGEETR